MQWAAWTLVSEHYLSARSRGMIFSPLVLVGRAAGLAELRGQFASPNMPGGRVRARLPSLHRCSLVSGMRCGSPTSSLSLPLCTPPLGGTEAVSDAIIAPSPFSRIGRHLVNVDGATTTNEGSITKIFFLHRCFLKAFVLFACLSFFQEHAKSFACLYH